MLGSQTARAGRNVSPTLRNKLDRPRGLLVVDDDPVVRTILGMLFRQHGLHVRLASNGNDAVDVYRRHGDEIALVLLDVLMPVMDGPHTFARLREIDPSVACYFMSGDCHPYTEDELLSMGAIGFAAKPFTEEMFEEIVDQCLAHV